MLEQIVRGPLLIPSDDGTVAFHSDGALASDETGTIRFAGDWKSLGVKAPTRPSRGVMMPPLIDIHTHIPQHPIRGQFLEGVPLEVPGGRLLAGLQRNVFPTEAKCREADCVQRIVARFYADTLKHGVVGGATYMTPWALATEIALKTLPPAWSVGLVLMNQNCPENLRTDEEALDRDLIRLAQQFGPRLIVTDRFAVAVNSPLRKRAAKIAGELGLRTQTHLNEQPGEKEFVETKLYPDRASYTDVYLTDGLLDYQCIAAHCIQMRDEEWKILADTGSAIAHCPTSNLLLGSGLMPLDRVREHRIPFALGTDVGASPTVSMLAEMARFLAVHQGRATPAEALYRATLAPAKILGLSDQLGRLEIGRPISFIEVEPMPNADLSVDAAIRSLLPIDLENPEPAVNRVTLAGSTAFERSAIAKEPRHA
ncbi:MAG TPA: amidohydrolase family protein [Tepidisphaeraceae bacterium]|nr:amidohydrolase family protein [Tepidisphaeraceae bacterium]